MENLLIEKTQYSPEINFNIDTGEFSIKGKSYMENTFEFYKPILLWVENYFKETKIEKTVVDVELTYLNSSSLKACFDLFDYFEHATEKGHKIEVNWIYDSEDDIIEETGKDFIEDFENIDIKLIVSNS